MGNPVRYESDRFATARALLRRLEANRAELLIMEERRLNADQGTLNYGFPNRLPDSSPSPHTQREPEADISSDESLIYPGRVPHTYLRNDDSDSEITVMDFTREPLSLLPECEPGWLEDFVFADREKYWNGSQEASLDNGKIFICQ